MSDIFKLNTWIEGSDVFRSVVASQHLDKFRIDNLDLSYEEEFDEPTTVIQKCSSSESICIINPDEQAYCPTQSFSTYIFMIKKFFLIYLLKSRNKHDAVW